MWTRENDPSRPAIAPGMGVRFDRLAEGSQQVLEKILAEKAKQAPQRAHTEQTKPPMFTDTPTRVAPAPVQEALLGNQSGRARPHARGQRADAAAQADAVPLRRRRVPRGGVRGGDQGPLARRAGRATAPRRDATGAMPRDELAARRGSARADSTLADPPVRRVRDDRAEDATSIASPHRACRARRDGPQRAAPQVLDTSPSPRQRPSEERAAALPPAKPAQDQARHGAGEGHDASPPTASAHREGLDQQRAPRVGRRARARDRPSNAPIVIGILLVVAAGVAALWFFVLREPAADAGRQATMAGSAAPATRPRATGPGSAAIAAPRQRDGSPATSPPAAPAAPSRRRARRQRASCRPRPSSSTP